MQSELFAAHLNQCLMIDIERKPGYLYLLRDTMFGGYKLGITTSPTARFKALAVGTKTEIIGYWQHDCYRELEKHFHKFYSSVRVPQSEYFKLSAEMVQTIVNQMYSSAITQYLSPEVRPQFVGSSFHFSDTPPHIQNKYAGWQYFSVLVLIATVVYLLTSF